MLSTARRSRAGGPLGFIVLIAVLTAACGASAGGALAPVGGAVPGASSGPAFPGDLSGEEPGEGDGGNGNGGGGQPLAADPEGLLIIKTGALAIQVAGLDQGLTAANQLIGGIGGYASASEREGDGEFAQATITYRIPVARWDEALAGLRGLGEKVLDERYTTNDVTSQVVDLGATIANLRATETALQAIMERAVEIEDVLRVQAELTRTRSEIERLTAQKTNLEGQAAFSTLAVTFALKPNPVLTEQQGFDPATEVEQASASLVAVLQGLATAGIWFAIVWIPILLGLAIVIGLIVVVVRRLSRRLDSSGDAPAAPLPTPEGGA